MIGPLLYFAAVFADLQVQEQVAESLAKEREMEEGELARKQLMEKREALFRGEWVLTRAALHLKAKGDLSRDELHDECVAYMVLVGCLAKVQAELLEVLRAERTKERVR